MKMNAQSMRTLPLKILVCSLVLFLLIAAGKAVQVNRDTPGRTGPGSFYGLTVLIPSGSKLTVTETKKSWHSVAFQGNNVWIAENSLGEAEKKSDNPFAGMSTSGARASASPATISAAIKGFWTRFTKVDKSTLAEVPVNGYDISPSRVEAFVDDRASEVSRSKLMKKYKEQRKFRKIRMPYVKEKQLGFMVASSVAEGTLLEDESILAYLHSVGWYIAEATERHDIRFNFYILDTPKVNAIACPGGYIILTRGVLDMLDDEAELAALLAHEMSHVIAGHGTSELEDEGNKIGMAASDAFAKLDDEVGTSEMEQELGAIGMKASSVCRSPKLDKYEFEADAMALRYMARSGYDLDGHFRLLNKLKKKHDTEVDIFDLNYRNHPDFEKRIKSSEKELKEYKRYSGKTFTSSFSNNMN
ncbi:M48 family metalloprotease [Candidatus Latescibacterota bacterium]